MIEEFIHLDREVTMLTLRHFDPAGQVRTTVIQPIAHLRPGTVYHQSWQPEPFAPQVETAFRDTATHLTDELGGLGIFGVECFVAEGEVYFSEVSPRSHDTGLVTLGSQWKSEFALHARVILGLPYAGPEQTTPAAARVILGSAAAWAPSCGGLAQALTPVGRRTLLFGKPESCRGRRLGIAIARAPTTEEARWLADTAAPTVGAGIKVESPGTPPQGHPA